MTILLSFSSVFAIEFEDAVFPELAVSSRALAMGNAFIAKVDDASSAFYNPAGLGTVRFPHIHLSNLHIESNKGWLSSSGGGRFTDSLGNLSKGFSLDGQRKLLLENRGEIAHTRFQALPNFTSRFFTMGYLISKRTRATIGKVDTAKFEYAQRTDHGPYMGINLSIWGGIFKIGTSFTYLNRKEAIGEADRDTAINLTDADYKKGSALIINLGSRLTLPIAMLPTFAINSHNAAQTDFNNARGAGKPDAVKNTIDLGFSLTPQIGDALRVHMEVNYKDSTNLYKDVASTRKLGFGLEFDFARVFFMRFGYGDGFGSAGLGIKTKSLEFDLTTYAVDTTTNEYRGAEDRRFAIGFSSGF